MLLDHSLDDVLLDSSPYVFHIKDLRLCRLVIKPLNIIRTSSATWCQSFYSHFIGNLEWSYNVFILCWLHHWGIIFKKSTHVYTSCLHTSHWTQSITFTNPRLPQNPSFVALHSLRHQHRGCPYASYPNLSFQSLQSGVAYIISLWIIPSPCSCHHASSEIASHCVICSHKMETAWDALSWKMHCSFLWEHLCVR